ncbi:MAG: hypothetical protein RIC80_13975 [Cyclobacteriaceae bacterium]
MSAYLVVFTLAAQEYPGGSENIPHDMGYSYFHNFLCDAMLPFTPGGIQNPARHLATISHLILSGTMILFFFLLPMIFDWTNRNTRIIRYVGMLTMTVFVFMYTDMHDHIVTATGVLGTVALIPFFLELKRYPSGGLKTLAYTCFILSIIVFFSFETKIGFYYLPLLQKVTFVFDAWWVIWVSLIVMRKNENTSLSTARVG